MLFSHTHTPPSGKYRSSFLGSLDATERSDTRFVTSSLMSDTDRQVYFSDHVIELQNTEDEKRRRIRDARRRAEKAQVSFLFVFVFALSVSRDL